MRLLYARFFYVIAGFGFASSFQTAARKTFDQLFALKRSFLVGFSSSTFDASDPNDFQTIFTYTAESVQTALVWIDCEKDAELCKQYDVNAYPAVRLFHPSNEGESEESMVVERYRGRRTKNALVAFMKRWEYRSVTAIEISQMATFKGLDDFVMIAYLRPDESHTLEVYQNAASRYNRRLIVGYSTDPEVADTDDDIQIPSIKCYRNIDGAHQSMSDPLLEVNIEQFIQTCIQSPLIGEFTERNMDEYMQRGKLSVYIFVTTEEDAAQARKELTPLATRFKQIAKVGIADAVEYGPMAKNFGLLEDVFPALAVHAPHNDNVFLYKQGRHIRASVFEEMMTTILSAKAANGQVFGIDAPLLEEAEFTAKIGGHDEL